MKSAPAAIAALVVLALSGCVPSVAQQTVRGIPEGYEGEIDLVRSEPFAAWHDDRSRFTITTFGSSSCAPVPTSIEAPHATSIAVTFVAPSAPICTADIAPTTHVFGTPANVDVDAAVTVHVLLDYSTEYRYDLAIE